MISILYIGDCDNDFDRFDSIVNDITNVELNIIRAKSEGHAIKHLVTASIDLVLFDSDPNPDIIRRSVASLRLAGFDIPIIMLIGNRFANSADSNNSDTALHFLYKEQLTPAILYRAVSYFCSALRNIENHELAPKPDVAPPNQSSKIRILLIEDDDDDFWITRTLLLEVYGANLILERADNIPQAQSMIEPSKFDVVIVDFRLGDCIGLEIVKNAVESEMDCPFIVLTGEDSRETDIAALQAGATDYLVKSDITAILLDRAIRYSIERFRSEKRLAKLAKYDQLTGLANRYLFQEVLEREIQTSNESGSCFGLLLVDLDRFKQVNDTHGHAIGDFLLQAVANRITRLVRASDLVARLGGDEFVIVITEMQDSQDIFKKAFEISEALHEPLSIKGIPLEPGASIGVSIYPDDARSAEELIASADTAMYSAKQQPPLRVGLYTSEMRLTTNRRLSLERTMRFAIEASQFHLRYQPKYHLRSQEIRGYEALLRWCHPELGEVAPSEFVQIAEENGSIIAIGDWVLVSACAQIAQWRDQGMRDICIAVNVSARQLCDGDLPHRVSEILNIYQVPPNNLEIEITESDIMRNPTKTFQILERFMEIGVGVALDDFGTGYSSLVHLRDFPGNCIKIDKSFISNLGVNERDSSIVESLITVAHRMKMETVAEGVESHIQLEFLRQRNCDFVQGYLVSRPIPATSISFNHSTQLTIELHRHINQSQPILF